MVCVPCFIIPVLLYIWHKFVQPILLKYWNPWEKKDAEGNVIKKEPEFPFNCPGGQCPIKGIGKDKTLEDNKSVHGEVTKVMKTDDEKKVD